MKSLAERQKQRTIDRAEALKDSPFRDTGASAEAQTESDETGKSYAEMSIEELKAAAKELGGEVPKDKTLKADILEYVQNLAKFKAESEETEDSKTDAGWSAGAGA